MYILDAFLLISKSPPFAYFLELSHSSAFIAPAPEEENKEGGGEKKQTS